MLYVGIDVAKRSHEVVLLDDTGETRGKPFSIPNSHAGLSRLIGRVEQANPEQQRVVFGLEATSHYWLGLYSHLRKSGHEVVTLNPLQTSAYRRLQIRPVKNDRRDAWCIAEVLRLEPIVQTALASDAVLGLRHLSRLRSQMVDQMADQPVLARPGKRRVLPKDTGTVWVYWTRFSPNSRPFSGMSLVQPLQPCCGHIPRRRGSPSWIWTS